MEVTPKEFQRLARVVDEHHHEAMKAFRDDVEQAHKPIVDSGRRRFLVGSGLAATALGLGVTVGSKRLFTPAYAESITDEDLAAFAQSVELAAVQVYTAAAGALSAGTKPVAMLFMQHHQQHADAFGAVAKGKAVKAANAKLVAALGPALSAVKDEKGALELAFTLENQAAETYAFGLTVATGKDAIGGMATILPIETEHAAVLGIALGKAPGDIFVNGAFESAAVGDGSDIKKGIDPAKFPVG